MTDKLTPMERAAEAFTRECWGELWWSEQSDAQRRAEIEYKMKNFGPMIRAAILAYLSAIAEDEASVEAGARAMLADDTPKPSFDAAWENEKDIWMQNARSFLRTLLSRAKEQKP